MSKRVIESTSDSNGKSRQTAQSSQPLWMAHWMRGCNNSTTEKRDDSAHRDKELDRASKEADLTNGSEASRTVREPSVVETKAETESLRISSKSWGNEATGSSLMKHEEDTDETKAIRPIFNRNLEPGSTIECGGRIQSPSGVPVAKETSLREYHSNGEGTSKNPLDRVKACVSAKDTSPATSMPFLGSSTPIVPYDGVEKNEFDKGKAVAFPLLSRPSIVSNYQFPHTKPRILEQEHCHKHNQSACVICEGRMGSHLGLVTSTNAYFRERNRPLLLDAPPIKGLPPIRQDWLQKMQNCSGVSSHLNLNIASQKNESKISHYDNYSPPKLPNRAHDMETMRICTTLDSVEASVGGRPRFSQTTHSLFITKNVDANVSKEYDAFRSPGDVYNLPPFFGQANKGVKLQPLSSSSNSEGQGNVRDIGVGSSKAVIKNESSADTDTMDMDYLKEERPTSVANSTRSTKDVNVGTNLTPSLDIASSREVVHPWKSTGLPDINLELPASPAATSSPETAGPSSSRTQSLEMDVLLAQAEHPTPKSNLSPNDSCKADPTSRWVKRLKASSSDSCARGTKSSHLAENSCRDKKLAFLKNVVKNSISSSEQTPTKVLGKETVLSDKSQNLSREDEEGKELLLSHSWIKRWLHNGSQISEKKPEAIVVCEPQSSKMSVDDLQKKQFPSIAAMALMGKAMSGHQSCELKNRGNYTVWNTRLSETRLFFVRILQFTFSSCSNDDGISGHAMLI